jgi:hypothetical protein
MKIEKFTEKKKEWITGAIKKKGALRKVLGKKEGEKISMSQIEDELDSLKKKDKDKSKKGIQGLNKKDLQKFRRLNLAKTLGKFNESDDTENYMFFKNLENICRMSREILDEMNDEHIDDMLTNGHDWANDHISKAMEQLSHVYDFLKSSKDYED